MDLGIIGLGQSGKSTVFSAVTRGHTSAATHGAKEPAVGVVKIPDDRLDRLCDLLHPRKVTHAEARYLDFPGGLSVRGESPEAAYMAALSQCDALVHVVRAFRSDVVPHPDGAVDAHRDIAAVNLELAFADAAMLERRYDRLEISVRSAKAGEREEGERELVLVQRLKEALEREEPLRAQEISHSERRITSGYQLLTDKPMLIVVNTDEGDIGKAVEIESDFSERWAGPGVEVTCLCGKLEQELTELSDEEAAEFRADMGLDEGALERLLRLSQRVLGLVAFFTVNEADGHAWAVHEGATALEAAAKVHTDMARGFIRVEVIGAEELLESGSIAEARKRGILRTEGKQYVVQDGELLHILFNV